MIREENNTTSESEGSKGREWERTSRRKQGKRSPLTLWSWSTFCGEFCEISGIQRFLVLNTTAVSGRNKLIGVFDDFVSISLSNSHVVRSWAIMRKWQVCRLFLVQCHALLSPSERTSIGGCWVWGVEATCYLPDIYRLVNCKVHLMRNILWHTENTMLKSTRLPHWHLNFIIKLKTTNTKTR